MPASPPAREPAFIPPTADDLRRWLLLVSPTEIRLTLPDDTPGGDYTLRLGFEYSDAAIAPFMDPANGPLDGAAALEFTVASPRRSTASPLPAN